MNESREISRTLEDYLEAIAELIAKKRVARVRDIAQTLSIHKSTASAALKSLSDKGLVHHDPYEAATLTPAGRKLAEEVTHRHEVITRFLQEVLLLEEGTAQANACRMEHVLDKEVMERLRLFAKFMKESPPGGKGCLKQFRDYFEHHRRRSTVSGRS